MGKRRAKGGFGLGFWAYLRSLEVPLGAERVRSSGFETALVVSRWAKGGQRGDSGWGLGLVCVAEKFFSELRGSVVVAVRVYWL